MYAEYYGLTEPPFELTPNTRYLCVTARQREALSLLEYGLSSSKPITVVTGEAGTGKTLLIRAALESDRCSRVHAVCVNNPSLRPDDFIRMLAIEFELGADAAESKAIFLDRFEWFLSERHAQGDTTALIIDEAQALTVELLEEIRLLANIERPGCKLISLVLAGQPGLADRLDDFALWQLKQRVTLRCELLRFTHGETAGYVAHRISTAGGVPGRLFSREAITAIHRHSGGVARLIHVICDNALITAMALGRRWVDQSIIADVCEDLHLRAPDPPPSAEPASHDDVEEAVAPPRAVESDELPVDAREAAGGGGTQDTGGRTGILASASKFGRGAWGRHRT